MTGNSITGVKLSDINPFTTWDHDSQRGGKRYQRSIQTQMSPINVQNHGLN